MLCYVNIPGITSDTEQRKHVYMKFLSCETTELFIIFLKVIGFYIILHLQYVWFCAID